MNDFNKLVSIVVPIYNVSGYLEKCLDSIYYQLKANYEVILVDDGSTDISPAICESYKSKYPGTILIHKKNGGLSDARNYGVNVATGKYIFFVDSDDWLAPNALEEMISYAERYDCEIVQSNFYYSFLDYQQCSYANDSPDKILILSREQAMHELIRNEYIKNFAWGKLILTSIVKKYDFPKGRYFEDAYWIHYIINETTNYGILYKPLYYYRQRNESISAKFSIRNIDLLKGYESRLVFIRNKYSKFYKLMLCKYWEITTSFYRISKRFDDQLIKQSYKEYWDYANRTYQKPLKCTIMYSTFLQFLLRVARYLKRKINKYCLYVRM